MLPSSLCASGWALVFIPTVLSPSFLFLAFPLLLFLLFPLSPTGELRPETYWANQEHAPFVSLSADAPQVEPLILSCQSKCEQFGAPSTDVEDPQSAVLLDQSRRLSVRFPEFDEFPRHRSVAENTACPLELKRRHAVELVPEPLGV